MCDAQGDLYPVAHLSDLVDLDTSEKDRQVGRGSDSVYLLLFIHVYHYSSCVAMLDELSISSFIYMCMSVFLSGEEHQLSYVVEVHLIPLQW